MNYVIKSPTMAYMPEYLASLGCCYDENMGMVTPANVATLGSMNLGRSTYSYDRAIARVKAKIKLLRKKRRRVRLKARKRIIKARIARYRKKLSKLRAYKKIKKQKVADKQGDSPVAEDEDFLLMESMEQEPLIDSMELEQEEQMMISGGGDMDWGKIALFGGLALVTLVGVKMILGKKAPRRNRLKMGRKSNPKRKTSKRRKSKSRR